MLRRFLADRSGVTSIDYALVAGFVSVLIVVAVRSIGVNINAKFFGPLLGGLH